MIIGRGMLANAFAPAWAERDDVVIVAAGVSNSTERDPVQFAREERLIGEVLARPGPRRIVYFGSCAVGNPYEIRTPYLEHKARMEALVLEDPRGLVLRLPQVIGSGGNPHTLTNFLSARIRSGMCFDVWTFAERNLIDVCDVAAIGGYIIANAEAYPTTVSLADTRSTRMPVIVKEMERAMGRAGNYRELDRGVPFPIDTTECLRVSRHVGVKLGEGYLRAVIGKYYSACARSVGIEGMRVDEE